MNRKIFSTLILALVLLVIVIGSGVYSFIYQNGQISDKEKKIKELDLNSYNTEDLMVQLDDLKKRAVELDSILSLRKFNIPVGLSQSRFYDFINKVSFSFSPDSYVNIAYSSVQTKEHFKYYVYELNGTSSFNDLYKLIYSIEQSKELKKVASTTLDNFVKVDEEGLPHYLVNFKMRVSVYFSDNDRFASSNIKENRLTPNPIYNIFYPLIRNEIPPNTKGLLDVQNAQLLALIPDGAFLSDQSGNTFLLWEGDEVYLGYLTEIDYDKNEVRFILNKGGIIERVALTLDIDQKIKEK